MSFRGPSIIKVNGGLGQQAPSDSNIGALVFLTGYEDGTFLYSGTDTIYKFTSLDDLEALGVTESSDANSGTTSLIWYNVSEFFRLNPDGTLYVFNGEGATTVPDALDLVLAASSNKLKYAGIIIGDAVGATLTIANDFDTRVIAAVATAQAWVTSRAAEFIYIDAVVIEGFGAEDASTPRDLTQEDAPQVSITVACDHGYLAGISGANIPLTAAVGTALGSIGVRLLSESIGSVTIAQPPLEKRGAENYSLVDKHQNRWLTVGTSFGVTFDSLSQTVRDGLTDANYIYAGSYQGYEGVYFNAEPTCTLATDDFNTIHANRIWNESARRIRKALIPRMNSRVLIDPDTGAIAPATIADWDAAARRAMDSLLAAGEIADYRFVLDPNQDVIAQGKVITKLRVVPQGIAKAIEAEIGFTNPAQQ